MTDRNRPWPWEEETKKKSDVDPDDLYPDVTKVFKPRPGRLKIIYLSDVIEKEKEIQQICMLLRDSAKEDEVRFYLSGLGGRVDLGIELLNAIDDSKATIVGDVVGVVHSMHALLATYMPTLIIRPSTGFMFHDISTRMGGKLSEIKSQVTFYNEWVKSLVRRCTKGLLTENEMEAILDSRDLWISGEDMQKRLDKKVNKNFTHVITTHVPDDDTITKKGKK